VRRLLAAAVSAVTLVAGSAHAEDALRRDAVISDCILAAAHVHRLPPALLVTLLNVEGGSLGRVSHNTNGTVDIGPMQVNQIWLSEVAAHWHSSTSASYFALRDNFCANVEAGAWILRKGLDEARGDFWEGVGYYHSHDPAYKRSYLHAVLAQILRLRALVQRAAYGPGVPNGPAVTLAANPPNRSK